MMVNNEALLVLLQYVLLYPRVVSCSWARDVLFIFLTLMDDSFLFSFPSITSPPCGLVTYHSVTATSTNFLLPTHAPHSPDVFSRHPVPTGVAFSVAYSVASVALHLMPSLTGFVNTRFAIDSLSFSSHFEILME